MLYTLSVGDFNNDDIDDYGIVFEASSHGVENSRVELYFGSDQKADWVTPDIVFQHEKGLTPSFPARGDYNGDGISDLAINYEDSSSGLNIYFGGEEADQNPDYQITVTDLNPDNNSHFEAFNVVENIGDINEDGVDDLLFSSRYISPFFTKSFILFGGENISETPDLELSYKAINATALGDIDADGKNEILVVNSQSTGYIYQSFDEENGEQFNSEAEYVLSSPSIPGSVINQFGVSAEAGDFDGDGMLDLAVKSAIHVEGSRVGYIGFLYEGAPAIYVYYGGDDFDEEYDQSFKIPLEFIRKFDLEDDQSTSFSFNEFGELTVVSDINNDGTDELLFATDQGNNLLTNALLFMGNEERSGFGANIGYVFEALNTNLGLGSLNNDLESFTSHSAVGDFNADGKIDILLPQGGDWNFKVDPVLLFSFGDVSVSIDEPLQMPDNYSLLQNYPNPFNPNTKISYKLSKGGAVKLEVFDISGRLISTIVNERQAAGRYTQNFDASNLASGLYIYRLQASGFTQTRKMLLIK